ncbi:MAG: SurA N-terminal domain-containing protein [Rhodospirillaceae bacterium]|nr:SurA N-terminal domain-containing protein [Rhodospirillaceae bacterium]
MLTAIRTKASSWIIKVLLFLLVGSFALWGIGDIIRGFQRDPAIATVNGEDIPTVEYIQALRKVISQYERQTGQTFSYQEMKLRNIDQRIIDNLIERKLLNALAADLNIGITDPIISKILTNLPIFKNQMGVFDPALYQAYLRSNGLTSNEFIQQSKDQILSATAFGSALGDIETPDILAKNIYQFRNEKRVVETFVMDFDQIEDPGMPSDTEIDNFYNIVKQTRLTPERRNIIIAKLSIKNLAADLVTNMSFREEDLHQEYDNNIPIFHKNEKRSIEQIVFTTKEQAEDAYQKLQNGQSFTEFAVNLTGTSPIFIEQIEKSTPVLGLSSDVIESAFSLKDGEISKPVNGIAGWHIIRLVRIQPENKVGFAEAIPQLKMMLARNEAEILADKRRVLFEDQLAAGDNFLDAAKAAEFEVVEVSQLTMDAGTAQKLSEILGYPIDRTTLLQITRLNQGQYSNMLITAAGDYTSFFVEKIDLSTPRPLLEVREELIKQWQSQQKLQKATEKIESVIGQAANQDFLSIASQVKGTVITSSALTRNKLDQQANIDAILNSRIFSMTKIGEIIYQPSENYIVVAKLTEIQKPDVNVESEDYKDLRATLSAEFSNDIGEQLIDYLKSFYHVEINQEVLDKAFQ